MNDALYSRAPLKWAGGKRRLLDRLLPLFPTTGRLFEPFVGSAIVFMNSPHRTAVIADTNPDLIAFYQALKARRGAFIEQCREYFVPENNTRERYNMLRARFNASTDAEERAALLLYLNRHGFNGLWRVNKKGGFNVPIGRYKKPMFPEAAMRIFYEKARGGTTIRCCDFEPCTQGARAGDVVYCDPPYVPLSATAFFSDYTAGGFGAKDQRRLADMARRLSKRGVTVVISNHDTPESRGLYEGSEIQSFGVQRMISRDVANRAKAPELLAVFRP